MFHRGHQLGFFEGVINVMAQASPSSIAIITPATLIAFTVVSSTVRIPTMSIIVVGARERIGVGIVKGRSI